MDCADVAINSKQMIVRFLTQKNFLFTMSKNLLRQNGEDCHCLILFKVNATEDVLVLGAPAFASMNISVDYETGRIGLSGGVDLTVRLIDYTPRAALLAIVFTLISLVAYTLAMTTLKLERKEREIEAIEKERQDTIRKKSDMESEKLE